MTRQQHIKFCEKCLNRKFDFQKGLICSLTQKIADFEKTCPNFAADQKVIDRPLDDNNILDLEIIKDKLSDEEFKKLHEEQNIQKAIIAGVISSFLCSILWTVITIQTNILFEVVAAIIGAIVGFSVRYFGKGVQLKFAIIGGLFAMLGCFLGNIFSLIGLVAIEQGLDFMFVLNNIEANQLFNLYFDYLGIEHYFFYITALFEGLLLSTRQITEKSLKRIFN